jgi:hypothetical protein
MTEHVGHECDRVEWRRLNDYLWAGSSGEGPVGTIERGRRFSAIDTSGEVIARCRDLRTAQAVLAGDVGAAWASERDTAKHRRRGRPARFRFHAA